MDIDINYQTSKLEIRNYKLEVETNNNKARVASSCGPQKRTQNSGIGRAYRLVIVQMRVGALGGDM